MVPPESVDGGGSVAEIVRDGRPAGDFIMVTVSNLHICVGIHYTLYTIHYNRDALDVGMQCRVVHCAVHCAEWCSAVHSAVH
jgi:hypothetical protein